MKSSFLILVGFLLNAFSVAAQTTVTIPAAADNTLYENLSGNSNALGQNIFSGTNGGTSPRRGLIKFDVAAVVPAGATITSATVTLNCNLSRAVPDNVSLHKLTADWGEGTSNAGSTGDGAGVAATANDATWAARFFPGTLWTTPGGEYNATASATISINNTGFYQWSSAALTADVQGWLITPDSNFGWIIICNETAASTARKFGSKENATAASRPSLSVTYTPTTLPVLLTHFSASVKNGAVALNWETSQEINNRYFEILHSVDGASFSFVGKMDGHGTTATRQQYGFLHERALPGNHFYKLAQVDFDGKRNYSPVERVFISTNSGIYSHVYPNPVLNGLTVFSSADLQNATYKIVAPNGSVLATGTAGTGRIKTDWLASGTYYLCLYGKTGLFSRVTFIKL